MALGPDAVRKAGELLGRARMEHRPVTPLPEDCRPMDETDAYAVQDALHTYLVRQHGAELAGYKIGCTTPVMQQLLEIPTPAYGHVRVSDVFHGQAEFDLINMQMPGVECEIAVRLGRDLPPAGAPFDRDTVTAAVDTCMAAMEAVDNRYGDFRAIGSPTLIADDFFQTACVLGPEIKDWRDIDLAATQGTTTSDDDEKGTGSGADVMGHPFEPIVWLANKLAARGQGLKAGQIILTGSLVEVYRIGDRPETATI